MTSIDCTYSAAENKSLINEKIEEIDKIYNDEILKLSFFKNIIITKVKQIFSEIKKEIINDKTIIKASISNICQSNKTSNITQIRNDINDLKSSIKYLKFDRKNIDTLLKNTIEQTLYFRDSTYKVNKNNCLKIALDKVDLDKINVNKIKKDKKEKAPLFKIKSNQNLLLKSHNFKSNIIKTNRVRTELNLKKTNSTVTFNLENYKTAMNPSSVIFNNLKVKELTSIRNMEINKNFTKFINFSVSNLDGL